MSWVLWLAIPAGVVVLAALLTWVRARPRRPPSVQEAMRAHEAYLDALAKPPLGRDRL
jgi:hypothetical protein